MIKSAAHTVCSATISKIRPKQCRECNSLTSTSTVAIPHPLLSSSRVLLLTPFYPSHFFLLLLWDKIPSQRVYLLPPSKIDGYPSSPLTWSKLHAKPTENWRNSSLPPFSFLWSQDHRDIREICIGIWLSSCTYKTSITTSRVTHLHIYQVCITSISSYLRIS